MSTYNLSLEQIARCHDSEFEDVNTKTGALSTSARLDKHGRYNRRGVASGNVCRRFFSSDMATSRAEALHTHDRVEGIQFGDASPGNVARVRVV